MFGYITPLFCTLSDEDKALWQVFYCNLCREIGKLSQPARLGLSYDLTFLALLICALSGSHPITQISKICPFNPTKKTAVYSKNDAFTYTAKASVILIKEKLKDDASDKKNPLFSVASRFIKDVSGEEELKCGIAASLLQLGKIEEQNILDIDQSADAFAVLCAKLFSLSPTPDSEKRKLYWLGYNLGRWIYLSDAWDDLEKDMKKGNYNPFADGRSFDEIKQNSAQRVCDMLTFTLSEAGSAFDLLNIKRYRSLLENIIYQGLPARQEAVMKGIKRNESIRGFRRKPER